MTFKQTHEMEGTLADCFRMITQAIGHCDYEVTGNQIVVRHAGKRLVISLVYEGDRYLGSLDLPMTEVQYEFIGYTKDEMEDFMTHLEEHLIRTGG